MTVHVIRDTHEIEKHVLMIMSVLYEQIHVVMTQHVQIPNDHIVVHVTADLYEIESLVRKYVEMVL